jgi:hypothetical protein
LPLYYFGIETSGVEPGINMIITLQFAKLTRDFEPETELSILKVWEFNSEKELIKKFLEDSKFFEEPFTFIPIGVNLVYDIIFIYERARLYGLVSKPLTDILHEKPFIDIKPILVIINNCEFRNYNKIIDSKMMVGLAGSDIPILYAKKEYKKIEEYIREEYRVTLEILKQIQEILIKSRDNLLGERSNDIKH